MQRYSWVDAAKGISISLVVLLHAAIWLRFVGLESDGLDAFNLAVSDLRMPTFFLASGIFASKWLKADLRRLWSGKVALLVWVFIIWQPLVFGYKLLAGATLPNQHDAGLTDQLLRVLISPVRPNAELWFLWALALYFVGVRMAAQISPRVVLGATALGSVAWSSWAIPTLGDEGVRLLGPGLVGLPLYAFFFCLGAYGGRKLASSVAQASVRLWAVVALAWSLLFIGVGVDEAIREVPGVRFACEAAGAAAGVAVGVLLQACRPLAYLGRHTLAVYLTHTSLVVVLACVAWQVNYEPQWWLAVLAVPSVIAAGLLFGRAARRTSLLTVPSWFSGDGPRRQAYVDAR